MLRLALYKGLKGLKTTLRLMLYKAWSPEKAWAATGFENEAMLMQAMLMQAMLMQAMLMLSNTNAKKC